MLILLLSLCLGLANAARGAGVKGGKAIVIVMMYNSAYIITHSLWSLLFPIPLLAFWWQPGGTGRYMKEIIKLLLPLGFGDNTWRFFEFFSIFVYSLIYLSFGTL